MITQTESYDHINTTDDPNVLTVKLGETHFFTIKKVKDNSLTLQVFKRSGKKVSPNYPNYTVDGFATEIVSTQRPIKSILEDVLNPDDSKLNRESKKLLQKIALEVQEYYSPEIDISQEEKKGYISFNDLDMDRADTIQLLQYGYVEDEKWGYVCESFHSHLKDSDELEHLVLVSVADIEGIRSNSESPERPETPLEDPSDQPSLPSYIERYIELKSFKDNEFKKSGVILSNPLAKWALNKQVANDIATTGVFYLGFNDPSYNPSKSMKESFDNIFKSIDTYIGIENAYQKTYTAILPISTYYWQVFAKGGITKVGGGHEAGKSNWSNFVNLFCYHAGTEMSINPSNSFLFRSIESYKSTLIIDENNQYDQGIAVEIINACHSRSGGSVSRIEKTNYDSYVPTTHNVYCPVILAGVKVELRPDTMSRTINVDLFSDKEKDYLEPANDFYLWEDVRNSLMKSYLIGWSEVLDLYIKLETNQIPLNPYDPSFDLKARDKDIWIPIFTILNYVEGEEFHYSNLMKHIEANKTAQEIESLTDSLKAVMFKTMARLKARIEDENDKLWYDDNHGNISIMFRDIKDTASMFGYEFKNNNVLDKDLKKLLNITEKGRHPEPENRGSTRIIKWDMIDRLCQKSFNMTLDKIDDSFDHLEDEGTKIDSWTHIFPE